MICCAPETPEELVVQFFLSNKKVSNQLISADNVKSAKSMLTDGRVVVVVHGFLNHFSYESIWNQTKNGWIDRGANVIIVDWSRGNRLYFQSMANVRVVGALVGQLIKRMGVAERGTCAGFSLGSHICGEAGAWLRKKGQTLSECHGIDPAGPGFDGCGPDIRLDRSDCGLVTVIHSSQFTNILGFGTKYKSGHCDFWMNDAFTQPMCGPNPTTAELVKGLLTFKSKEVTGGVEDFVGCSHSRAMKYYISQLQRVCSFNGDPAICGRGEKCYPVPSLYREGRSPSMVMPPDDVCDRRQNEDYRIQTTGKFPFC